MILHVLIAMVAGWLQRHQPHVTDFSVVLFRSKFMLVSEVYLMKVHKNQWLLTLLSLPEIPYGGTNQGTYPGA